MLSSASQGDNIFEVYSDQPPDWKCPLKLTTMGQGTKADLLDFYWFPFYIR